MPYDEDNEKWSCDPCIRGHRATKCEHWDRVMVRVKKPGRPLQTCPHGSAKPNCGCGREKVFMIKVSMEGGKCVCRVKQRANEFNHPVGDKFDTTVSQKGGLYTSCEEDKSDLAEQSPRVQEALASPHPDVKVLDIAQVDQGWKGDNFSAPMYSPPLSMPSMDGMLLQNHAATTPHHDGNSTNTMNTYTMHHGTVTGYRDSGPIQCGCGSGCNCVFCPEHPNNAASSERARELMACMEEEFANVEVDGLPRPQQQPLEVSGHPPVQQQSCCATRTEQPNFINGHIIHDTSVAHGPFIPTSASIDQDIVLPPSSPTQMYDQRSYGNMHLGGAGFGSNFTYSFVQNPAHFPQHPNSPEFTNGHGLDFTNGHAPDFTNGHVGTFTNGHAADFTNGHGSDFLNGHGPGFMNGHGSTPFLNHDGFH